MLLSLPSPGVSAVLDRRHRVHGFVFLPRALLRGRRPWLVVVVNGTADFLVSWASCLLLDGNDDRFDRLLHVLLRVHELLGRGDPVVFRCLLMRIPVFADALRGHLLVVGQV